MAEPLLLPPEFLPPDYEGGSIANVPGAIAALLQVPFAGMPALRPPLWQPLAGGVRRVVLLIIDALGSNLIERNERHLRPVLEQAALSGQLTSIFPSTTVAALTSLWTGLAPAQHGLLGLHLFFPDFAVLGQMLSLSPVFHKEPDALLEAGLEPESFLSGRGFAEQLAAAGIPTHAFKERGIVHSALSRMHGRGVAGEHAVYTFSDMLEQIRAFLEATPGQPAFFSAYWASVDTLSHIYSPFHPAVDAEVRALFAQIQAGLLEPLSPAARAGTLLFLVADHGQIPTPAEDAIRLADLPRLRELLLMRPAGEPRTPYLYARQGSVDSLLAVVAHSLGQVALGMSAASMLAQGWLGPPPYAPQSAARLGDVVLTMRGGHVLLTPDEEKRDPPWVGRHAGMTADEMRVPWLGFRLG